MGIKTNEKLVNAILSYGDKYREKNLNYYKKDKLLGNWLEALKFFFERAFYQGRSDVVSSKVHKVAVEVMEHNSSIVSGNLEDKDLELLKKELEAKIGKGMIGKARDVEMVISAFKYALRLPNLNIISHSIQHINAGDIKKHYNELQKSMNDFGIIQVGPKIASLYLLDLVSLFQMENKVSSDDLQYLQPVDVWVKKLILKIGIVKEDATPEQIQKAIVNLCEEQHCSPLKFNQGAWYAGYYSLDLLLENLGDR